MVSVLNGAICLHHSLIIRKFRISTNYLPANDKVPPSHKLTINMRNYYHIYDYNLNIRKVVMKSINYLTSVCVCVKE